MKKYYIYVHLNIINGKIYIGYSKNPKTRWKFHCRIKDDSTFHNAIQKYGEDNFKCYIIAYSTSLEKIKQKEIKFIKLFNTQVPNGYNMTKGGDGGAFFGKTNPFYNKHHSKDQKKKWSKERKGCKGNFKNKKHSKESRKNISKNHADISGDKNPMRRPEVAAKFKGKNNPMCRPKVVLKAKITKLKKYIIRLEQELEK